MVGTKFFEEHPGYTISGYGIVVKGWEVIEDLGNDRFKCKQISNNAVMTLNPDYTENFSRQSIEQALNPKASKYQHNEDYDDGDDDDYDDPDYHEEKYYE